MNVAPKVNTTSKLNLSRIESTEKVEAASNPPETKKPATKAVEQPKVAEPVKDPNGCEAKGMHYRADNNECIPKPTPVASAPVGVKGGGSGSCQAEIAKYDWSHGTALAVAEAESGFNPANLNDNPNTGDYSVGCFQINMYGANARTRPSEAELKNAAVNVAWAHKIYVANGRSFIGQWGVCRSKLSCY